MCKRVVQAQQLQQGKFSVTPQLCLAINNIDYVLQFIKPFVTELGMEETLVKLQALDGEMVASSCRRTLTTLVQNALENVENKILEVLDMVGEKVSISYFCHDKDRILMMLQFQMAPVIQKFLVEGSALVSYAARDKETLIQYLDKNMIVLKEELNETNFDRILSVIWECSAQSLSDTINLSIDVRITYFNLTSKFNFYLLVFLASKTSELLQNSFGHPEHSHQFLLRRKAAERRNSIEDEEPTPSICLGFLRSYC